MPPKGTAAQKLREMSQTGQTRIERSKYKENPKPSLRPPTVTLSMVPSTSKNPLEPWLFLAETPFEIQTLQSENDSGCSIDILAFGFQKKGLHIGPVRLLLFCRDVCNGGFGVTTCQPAL
jgi:hypothetical protein